jgi:V8-like Glu-specific endopeptidase
VQKYSVAIAFMCVLLCSPHQTARAQNAASNQSCTQSIEPELLEQFRIAVAKRDNADKEKEKIEAELRAIYGCDDRKNFYDSNVTDNQRRAAQATALLVKSDQLQSRDNGTRWNLPGTGAHFCSPEQVIEANRKDPKIGQVPERFWQEPAPGFCSGFKVGKRRIATAGHCIKSVVECKGDKSSGAPGTSFVFGFKMSAWGDAPEKAIAKSNVYQCVRVVGGSYTDLSDWRVVEVDRDIDAPEVQVRMPDTLPVLKPSANLTVVGYPMGLPVKIAAGAAVRKIKKTYFEANLDTYGGNSGSAVFNTEKLSQGELLVEGILVRGENDFAQESPCFISKRCPNEGCRGEDVTLASEFRSALKK